MATPGGRYDTPSGHGTGLGVVAGQVDRARQLRYGQEQEEDPDDDGGGSSPTLAEAELSDLLRELLSRIEA